MYRRFGAEQKEPKEEKSVERSHLSVDLIHQHVVLVSGQVLELNN